MNVLQLATRSLRRSPGYVLMVVATLAIGIGLNAAIFTVVDNVLLRPLSFRDADRIVALRTHFDDENRSIPRLGGGDYSDLTRQVSGLEASALYQNYADGVELRGVSLYVPVANVAPRFLEILGVQPVAGRLFRSSDREGTDVVLGGAFARDHFGSAAGALGQAITYSGAVYTVVGVLPEGFSFPGETALWFERAAAPQYASRTSYNDHVLGKRRAGVTAAALDGQLAAFSANLRRAFPEDHTKSIEAVSLQEQLVGRTRPTLRLLMGAVLVILLIVCANIAHLQLVRATRQMRAVTIRTALGASRTAVATHALLETGLLAVAGTVAAILLAVPGLHVLLRLAPPELPRLADVRLNLDVLLFSFLISGAVMVVAAMLPVWRSWTIDPASALRSDAARGTESRGSMRLRNGFMVAEIALTVTLAVSAVLLSRELIAQSRQDLGFAPDSLLTLDTHAILSTARPVAANNTVEAQALYKQQWREIARANLARLDAVLASVAATPGVTASGAIAGAPMLSGGSDVNYAIKGRQAFTAGADLPNADLRPISPELLDVLGMRLLRGRVLTEEDRLGTPNVLLVNATLAGKEFPGQDPIGQQIQCGYDDTVEQWWTIVGVVSDIRGDAPSLAPTPTFYVPLAQHPGVAPDVQIVVRTPLNPAAMLETLRTRLLQTHPEVAVHGTTMRQNLGAVEQSDRFRATLFTLFAAVSILLAAIGMYGVTAYTVAQRRFEFGLRFALGATRGQVLGLVLGNALAVAWAGISLGIVLSVGLLQVLASVAGKLPGFDLLSYATASLGILVLAVLATLLPAGRAASVEPMTVLRSE